MSRCIVSEPLAYELPTLLTEGLNYLTFDTPEACVEACKGILDDPELAATMRRANYDYYQQHIAPGALIGRMLETALAHHRKTRDLEPYYSRRRYRAPLL